MPSKAAARSHRATHGRPATPVIGRDGDVASLRAHLDAGERLVTIIGAPGTGKTTLARRFVVENDEASTREAWFCDLTEARDAGEIGAALGRTLGVPLGVGSTDPETQLGDAIDAQGDALFVLDNFEHVVEHVAQTLGRWLVLAPNARFLVTSRERLRLPSEVVMPLGPLGLPDANELDAATILASEAVSLLVDRARRVRGDFAPPAADAVVLRDIVRELDGLPLAIELAAARLGVLSPRELFARLAQSIRLDVLSSGARDAARRHSTLRSAIDWSWTMLDAHERSALAQCAVFRGGFTLEAAEAVVVPGESIEGATAADASRDVLDVVQALHDKSLVRAYEIDAGDRRLGLYVSIAQYASERLAGTSVAARAHARHAAYFARAGRRWANEVAGAHGLERLSTLAIEQGNLTAVVERDIEAAADAGRADAGVTSLGHALDALLALDPLRASQGPIDAHIALLDHVLARAERRTDLDLASLALAYDARARARLFRARGGEARADADRAVELADRSGDGRVRGRVLANLATMLRQRGEMTAARDLYDAALLASRAAGDGAGEGETLGNLAILHKERGHLRDAREGYESAIELLRRVGDRRTEGRFRGDLGALHQEERRFDDARACFLGALAIHRDVGNRRFEAIALSDLGALSFETGAMRDADAYLRDAIAILRTVGDRRYEALFTGVHGAVQASLGRIDEARASLEQADAFLARVGDALFLGAVTVHRGHVDLALARLAAASGDRDAARVHHDAARARVAEAVAARADGAPSLASLSDDVRFATRTLEAALAALPASQRDALVIAPGAQWFRAPAGTERVDLSHRAVARRLLAALAEARATRPGEPMSLESLRERGWPDERVLPDAATNRIHVALSGLRTLGLKSILLRRENGYLLDPDVPLLRPANEPLVKT